MKITKKLIIYQVVPAKWPVRIFNKIVPDFDMTETNYLRLMEELIEEARKNSLARGENNPEIVAIALVNVIDLVEEV